MPRGIPNRTDTNDLDVGQRPHLDIPTTGSLEGLIRTDQEIIPVDGPGLDSYAAELAFNEELVEVRVHESTDENAEPIVDVYCNGIPQRFIRGQVQSVKRKYVEILARAKQTSIKTSVTDGKDGEKVNRINKHTAVRYPFSVERDDNPKGRDWLRKVLAEA